MASPKNDICRGCGRKLDENEGRVVEVRLGELSQHKGKSPVFKPDANGPTWGRMHERCFLIAIGDPKGIELLAS